MLIVFLMYCIVFVAVCVSVCLSVCLSVCQIIEKVSPFYQFGAVSLNSLQCVWVFLPFNVLLICVMGFMDFSRFVNSMYGFSRNCMIC